ncbi:MAG: hypothetical protein EOP23_12025 [Hyphomicrobiales bacterium]|jgi:hypothetical protein|nr:MAG: hypothetical protein EOP23_12025 [Hyphomicrobiales bacterium]
MIVSRAMAYACLMVFAGMLVLIAALMILLTIVQMARGETVPDLGARMILTVAAAGLAPLCRALARRLV